MEPLARSAGYAALVIFAAFAISLPATYDYVSFYKIKKSMTLGIRLDFVFSVYLLFAVAMLLQYGARAWRIATGGPFEGPPIGQMDPADAETRATT